MGGCGCVYVLSPSSAADAHFSWVHGYGHSETASRTAFLVFAQGNDYGCFLNACPDEEARPSSDPYYVRSQ